MMVLVTKEMVGTPLSPLMYGIHTEFQEQPRIFFMRIPT